MSWAIRFLQRHRAVALSSVAAYLGITMWKHKAVNEFLLAVRGKMDTATWNHRIELVLAPFVIAAAVWMTWLTARHPARRLLVGYGLLTVILAALGNRVLMANDTETAHYLQYAILAMLVFPLTGRLADTIIITVLCGMIDEGIQYWVHYRSWGVYYDFDDCIVNLVGAAFGALCLIAVRSRPADWPQVSVRRQAGSPAFVALAVVVLGCLALLAAGRLVYVRDPAATYWTIVLNRGAPHVGFWFVTNYGRVIHVVRPWEGALVLAVLMPLYWPLDWLMARSFASRERAFEASPTPIAAAGTV